MEGQVNDDRFLIPTKWGRFAAYGLIGWCAEVLFTGIHDFVRNHDRRLPSRSSIWMFPVYGLLAPLYEPLHDAVRDKPAPVRATAYGFGFLAVEYATGQVFRALLGEAPWDYSYAKRHVHGLIRPDYFPLWAAAGLALEPIHDILAGARRGTIDVSA
jgi:uncharacterized membrane protein